MTCKEKIHKVLIYDDDILYTELLEEKISDVLQTWKINYEIEKYQDNHRLTEESMRDAELFFLEIDMPGMSGIELAENIRKENVEAAIIFISNHAEMVFQAIHYAPLRFIRKECLEEELPEALRAWWKEIIQKNKEIELSTREGKVCIALNDIVYIESSRHYVNVCCTESAYEVRGRISDYENQLKEYGFIRVHMSFLVNCRYVKLLRPKEVLLSNGMQIHIGNKWKEEATHLYMKYVREKNTWKS